MRLKKARQSSDRNKELEAQLEQQITECEQQLGDENELRKELQQCKRELEAAAQLLSEHKQNTATLEQKVRRYEQELNAAEERARLLSEHNQNAATLQQKVQQCERDLKAATEERARLLSEHKQNAATLQQYEQDLKAKSQLLFEHKQRDAKLRQNLQQCEQNLGQDKAKPSDELQTNYNRLMGSEDQYCVRIGCLRNAQHTKFVEDITAALRQLEHSLHDNKSKFEDVRKMVQELGKITESGSRLFDGNLLQSAPGQTGKEKMSSVRVVVQQCSQTMMTQTPTTECACPPPLRGY